MEGPEKREKKRAARGMSRDREEEGGEIRWQSREESHNARFKAKFTTVDRR